MQKQPLFPNADAYVASLDGWRRECVDRLRASVLTQEKLQESVKWGHLVYEANGPVLLIRAEPERVLFGFWRGQRLRGIEPALRESGQYEMATIEIRERMPVDVATARALAKAAVALNEELGDPRLAAKVRRSPGAKRPAAAKRSDTSTGRKKALNRRAAQSRNTQSREAQSRETQSRRIQSREGQSREAQGRGAQKRGAQGKKKAPARPAKKASTSRRSRKAARRGG
jgi:hypothetical protein